MSGDFVMGRTPKSARVDRRYYLGVDLGQSQDYTALVAAERLEGRVVGERSPPEYRVGLLERLPLGTPYPKQVERVVEVVERLRGGVRVVDGVRVRDNRVEVVVDATGVGRPVVDLLRAAGLRPTPVLITGADTESFADGFYRVPKRNLVSVGQVMLQSKRLTVHRGLGLWDTLVNELQKFKVKISTSGHDSYEAWREGDHDDLVLAALLALWGAERNPPIKVGRSW